MLINDYRLAKRSALLAMKRIGRGDVIGAANAARDAGAAFQTAGLLTTAIFWCRRADHWQFNNVDGDDPLDRAIRKEVHHESAS